MAPEWEMGMEFGMGMGAAAAPPAPGYGASNCAPAYLYGLPSTDTLRIDDLLDFSNQEIFASSAAAATESHHIPHQPDVSSGAARESGSSSDCCYPHLSSSFADDIYIPSEEAAELEWLSKFVEDSFSDVPYPAASVPHTMSGNTQIRTTDSASNPGRGARSKRSRASAAAAALTAVTNWTSPPPLQIPTAQSSSSSSTSSSSSSDFPTPRKRNVGVGGADNGIGIDESGVRRCTHCGSEKTPQWRTGPLGPKTLCNACGVRFKSGRLVPEYRPAASPTFVLTQHSNSHRKVMELRRQKEGQHQRQPNVIYHDRLLPLS